MERKGVNQDMEFNFTVQFNRLTHGLCKILLIYQIIYFYNMSTVKWWQLFYEEDNLLKAVA